jgi:hypothetical protein
MRFLFVFAAVAAGLLLCLAGVARADEPDAGAPDAPPAADAAPPPPEPAAPFQPAVVATPVVATPVTSATPGAPGAREPGTGFMFGIRVGGAYAFGQAKDTSLYTVMPGAFLFGGDVGYFFSPHFYLGAYVLYGVGIGSSSVDTCSNPDFSCKSNLVRFGVVGEYHFLPTPTFDPWVGGGIGYEVVTLTAADQTGGGNDQTAGLLGFELVPRAGIDWKPGPSYGLGPYVEVPLGHYWFDTFTVHGWIMAGIRLHSVL